MSSRTTKNTKKTPAGGAGRTSGRAAENQNPEADGGSLGEWLRLWTRIQRFAWDFGGIICLALALMTLLSLLAPGLTGGLLAWWASILRLLLGWGSLWFILGLGLLGLWLLRRRGASTAPEINWRRVIFMEGAAITSIAILAVLGGGSLERAMAGQDGGQVGWGLLQLLNLLLSGFGLDIFAVQLVILGAVLMICLVAGLGLAGWLIDGLQRVAQKQAAAEPSLNGASPVISEAPLHGAESQPVLPAQNARRKRAALPPQFRKNFRVESEDERPVSPLQRDERLPPLDLLSDERSARPDERNINMTAGLIEKTLAEFGLPVKVTDFQVGPTVTQFALEPGYVEKDKPGEEEDPERKKVRVAQISALARDLALALSAERLRIQAPVPGRPFVGIEVPNIRSSVVRLRPILEAETFYRLNSPLTLSLGRDVSGQPVVADLVQMPHLLIAGTTGSGKSVSIAAMTTCLVMNNSPDDLRIVMIDPKMVELVRFNGLPHLYGVVETELERILGVLRWVVAEMERRYKLLEISRSRNIDTYNRKMHRRKDAEVLPRIVVMIDELADLMMSAPDQTEHTLVRLAQMARATGIHLVVATQRPSTDVVTGLIKANFPARMSFAVASSIDSRVILDSVGAESLLGKGDMLFLPPEAAAPLRIQGVMISDKEVERVINFWRRSAGDEAEQPPWEKMLEEEAILADRDELVEKAIEIVRRTQRASASMLQRRLRVGYPRAARLVDELEEMGVIGPAAGGREREVLLPPEENEDDDW